MPSIRIVLALAAALLLSACLPVTTKTPLGTTTKFAPDLALTGMWRGQNDKQEAPGYIGFIKNADDTMTAVMVSPESGSNDGDWETFSLKVVTLGGKHYMTARETFVKDKPADQGDPSDQLGNIIVFYRVEGKTLNLYFADEKKTAALIKAGKLHGTVSDDTSSPDIALTSDGAALDKFFASSAADALFVKPAVTLTKMP
jgi:hypothetical protein